MRFLVVGAGAIGGYVGLSLHAAGHDTVFLCRPRTAGAIRQGGFWFVTGGEENVFQPPVAEEPGEAFAGGGFDFTLVALKNYDTEKALRPLLPYGDQMGALVCLQNGVEAEAELARLFDRQPIIPGTVTTAVGRPASNRVVVERLRGIGIAGQTSGAKAVSGEMARAGLNARHYADALAMKWSKLLTNLTANPLSAILDMNPEEIFSTPALFDLEMRQLKEAMAVMRKIGARVINLPGTPVVLLAAAAMNLPPGLARLILAPALGKGRGGKMPSFHADLHSGKGRTEAPYLHGAVDRVGSRVGVDAPVCRFLSGTLERMATGQLALDTYAGDPQKLIRDLISREPHS